MRLWTRAASIAGPSNMTGTVAAIARHSICLPPHSRLIGVDHGQTLGAAYICLLTLSLVVGLPLAGIKKQAPDQSFQMGERDAGPHDL